MDFARNEGQEDIAGLVKKIFRDKVTPERQREVDQEDDRVDRKLWQELAKAGLLGIGISEAYGGSDQGLLEIATLLEEQGAAAAPIPLWETLLLGAAPIQEFGTEEQKTKYLSGVVSGEVFLCAALSELGAYTPYDTRCTATKNGDAARISGTKHFVPVAKLATAILTFAKIDDQLAVFLVNPKNDGISLEKQISTTGDPVFTMTMENAEAELLGSISGGHEIASWIIDRAQAGLCALELGLTKRVLVMTAKYTSERRQFDRFIATFQAVGQRAADAYIDVDCIRLANTEALWRLSEGLNAKKELAIAKYFAADAGYRVVCAAQHLHGGMGYDLDYGLARYFVLHKKIELTLGSATEHLASLGKELADSDDVSHLVTA